MAVPSPQEWAENWQKGLANNTEKIKRGIERTRKNPMERAIAQLPKMRTNFNAAMDSGKVERGLRRVSFEDWRRNAMTVGIPRIEQGARAAMPDVARFAAVAGPHIEAGLSAIEAMPSTTKADTRARMNFWFDHMGELEY